MEKLKLPRSSYEEIRKIIIAYSNYNKPASLDDIAQGSGMGRTNISANNAFLAYLAIIEGGNKKNATTKGTALGKALEHDMTLEIESTWSDIINDNDFLTKMIQAVKIRKGMEASQLENHIAFSSGEPKAGYVMTGAKAVVDILIASGLLKMEGEKLVAVTAVKDDTPHIVSQQNATENPAPDSPMVPIRETNLAGISLNIELTITASPSELEGLGKKIKSIIDELKSEE